MVLQRRLFWTAVKKLSRESGSFPVDVDADTGGRREGIALDMVDGQQVIRETVAALGRFVSRVAFVVNGLEKSSQLLCRFHDLSPLTINIQTTAYHTAEKKSMGTEAAG